ncbi:family 20 glycosylhydrolase [Amedibacillus dolichus]|uniref:family 20 glycosylhydrolase n=1 Tax=Amedibacillus dolichus TaxID=31971 RepID=UPI001EDBCCEC|nr:family 20 glycosylhydrolase [Amedibacillus dolichus]MCG4878974.1 family 20 glycosylhydrolase [Amedibacillus dolichus]
MKFMKKLLVASLAMVCAFGGAKLTSGTVTTVKAAENENLKKSVLSIDAGRKYFSEQQLKDIIDKAYKNGYTDVQLILGNDALRFFLDDMSITVNGTTYESEAVKNAMTEGNKKYYNDPNGNALTESEMNNILAYAKERGIGIIPLINSPGHMDAILVGMEALGMQDVRFTHNGNVSERTVNLRNQDAITFTQELVKKYAVYFGNAGVSEIFNFGADEYANDVFGNPGWSYLQDLKLYDEFTQYANQLAKIIKDQGMKPMCFNDGVYYNKNTSFGTFDKDIIISYWTSGWWGFNVAKPAFLSQQGHQILNTNDAWYWVLGNIDNGGYKYNDTIQNIEKKGFNDVTGAEKDEVIPTIGSMQAIWCDDPNKPHDMDRIFDLMDRFSNKHADVLIRPADYTKVDEAISKIPTDLSVYTDESVKVLNDATAAVIRNKRVTEQAVVDGYTDAINKAVEGLVFKAADYSKVDQAIEKANALNKKDYKNFELVEKAINAVERGLDIRSQDKVDAMAAAIEEAIANLELNKGQEQGTTKPENGTSGNVNTGDSTNMLAWGVLLAASLGLAGFILVKKAKARE